MGGISSISRVITHPKQGGGARGGFYWAGRKETKRKRGSLGFFFFFFLKKNLSALRVFLVWRTWALLVISFGRVRVMPPCQVHQIWLPVSELQYFHNPKRFWHRRQKYRLCHQSSNTLCLPVTQSRRWGHVLSAAVVEDGLYRGCKRFSFLFISSKPHVSSNTYTKILSGTGAAGKWCESWMNIRQVA